MAIPFKAYDVRGIYPSEIDEELMESIGKAFAGFVKGNKIAVGHDMRVSSKSLKKAFIRGVTSQGKTVLDFGLTSTPMSNFASCYLKPDGTAMITASHNPSKYNGVKFSLKGAKPVSGDSGLNEVEALARANNFISAKVKGQVVNVNIKDAYQSHLLKFIKKSNSKLRVVVDPANGMGSQDYNLVASKLPVITQKLFFKLDGTFPNHDANPMKRGATTTLRKEVRAKTADIGIAFDGDADRVFFIDEKGNQVPSDLITALIADELLDKKKGTILYDLRSSNIVKEKIKKDGGIPRECRVGHSFIKESMNKYSAIFAGELSGHYYFPFTIERIKTNFDSGIVTAIFLINLLNRKQEPLSVLINPLKKYFQTGEINSKVTNKDRILKKLERKYSSGKKSKLDGLKISFKDWWFNVRPSNTEPYLRLNLEAKTKELLDKRRDEVLKIILS